MRKSRAFTLTELLVVIGVIAVLASLLAPVASKARSAVNAASCLSNLSQMGRAWTMYTADNRSALLPYTWSTPQTPAAAWNGYWLGLLDTAGVRGSAILCPSADQPMKLPANAPPTLTRRGYGAAASAWTGRYGPNGTAITFTVNPPQFRDGSYAYNRYLTAKGGFGPDGRATNLMAVGNLSDVPAFMDCIYADVRPMNGSADAPVTLPPNLNGQSVQPGSPDHWKLLIARHANAINVCMADGSARLVPLIDLYNLTWSTGWQKYTLPLP